MNYDELLKLYKSNEFRKIDSQDNAKKFYLIRSISKSKTLTKFCNRFNCENDLNQILNSEAITIQAITDFINENFIAKTVAEIKAIESELNKMQNFDWGGSAGNSLEKNIVNNYIKKTLHYEDIEKAITGNILNSVYGYTMNSWYNHWSSIMIEEIFNAHKRIIPTLDLVEKIDFFIDGIPFDLKVTYFPEELMKEKIADSLYEKYGSKSELTCTKNVIKSLDIAMPHDLKDRAMLICLQNLLRERETTSQEARDFLKYISDLKQQVILYYEQNPNELIRWLYENQGEMRFDAANRFFVVLTDSSNIFDSWKLKRNMSLLQHSINSKLDTFSSEQVNKIDFYWKKDGKFYTAISEILFIIK